MSVIKIVLLFDFHEHQGGVDAVLLKTFGFILPRTNDNKTVWAEGMGGQGSN